MQPTLQRIEQLNDHQPRVGTVRVAHIMSGSNIWGVENYVHNLLTSKSATDLQPTVICTKSGVISEKFAKSGFPVSIIPISGYFDLSAINKLSDLFKRENIDVVHVHLGLDSFVGTAAAKSSQKPVVMSVHFDHPNHATAQFFVKKVWNQIQRLKNAGISHFLPITENVAAELMRRENVSREKISVIHPGIPLFDPAKANRQALRSQLNCDEQEIVIIGIGRLEVEKNFSCLIDAVAKMPREKKFKVLIVGDGAERPALAEAIERLNLKDRVQLLGYRSDIINLLGAAEIFVLPSKAEPFGMSAVEAMISALPVVATQGPGLATIVKDQSTGLLVPPDDAGAIADALLKLIDDPDLRTKFGAAGRERAIDLFTSDGMAERIVDVYRAVI